MSLIEAADITYSPPLQEDLNLIYRSHTENTGITPMGYDIPYADEFIKYITTAYSKTLPKLKDELNSEEFGLAREELLTLACTGTIAGRRVINIPRFGRSRYAGENDLMSVSKLIDIYGVDPDLSRTIVRENIIGIHGGLSGNLVSILDNGLKPLERLRAEGIVVCGGEKVNAFMGGNATCVSFAQWQRVDERLFAKYIGDGTPLNATFLREHIKEQTEAIAKFMIREQVGMDNPFVKSYFQMTVENERLARLLESPSSNKEESLYKSLIEKNFPVIYAVNQGRLPRDYFGIPLYSNIAGEFYAKGSVPKENNKIIFVPQREVGFVSSEVTNRGLEAKVFPLEHFLASK